MDDILNRSVTSHPPWVNSNNYNSNNNMTSLFRSLNSNSPHPHHRNLTQDFPLLPPHHNDSSASGYDVSTLADVTQCVFNATVNATVCEVLEAARAGGNISGTTLAPDPAPAHSLWLTILLGVLAAVVSIVTVLGNVTVLLAFGLERSIRQPTNYFIASLAVSDLLIGTFSMPLFTQYLLLNYWPLGPWLCDLWLSLDWTVCLTSQYTVFFITMDRFLSVKIPAKYRNWRSERKVLVMVAITWVLPAVVFFTTIIGWQYFVGVRSVEPKTCEVQFMSDPLFTFLLTIGYYWITLIVMCALYGGIYKVALELQRKSDAKQRKLESTMELAAERHGSGSATRGTASNSSDGERQKTGGYFRKLQQLHQKKKKSSSGNKGSDAGEAAGLPMENQNNVSRNLKTVNTTSFSGRNNLAAADIPRHDSLGGGSVATDVGDNKDEDRSSSPAFASDDEGSSSGATPGSKSPKGPPSFSSSNHRRSTKSSLNPKAGIAGIVNTAMLTTPESFRTTLMDTAHPAASFLDSGIPAAPFVESGVPSGPYVESGITSAPYGGTGVTSASFVDKAVPSSPLLDGADPSSPYIDGGEPSADLIDSGVSVTALVDNPSPAVSLSDNSPSAAAASGSVPVPSIVTGEPPPSYSEACVLEDMGGGGGTVMLPSGQSLKPTHGGPSYGRLDSHFDSSAETDPGEQSDTLCMSSDRPDPSSAPLLGPELQGCPYIDEKSFLKLTSGSGLAARPASVDEVNTRVEGSEKDSPLWKRRNSLPLPPLASDIFDIVLDDDVTDVGMTEVTSMALTSKLNGGREITVEEVCDDPEHGDGECSTLPLHHPHLRAHPHPHSDDATDTDSQKLSEPRRSRNKGDGRIHSFVKSVRSRNSRRRNRRERKSKSENRARKALRTITIILGAFVLCWTPYHIMLFVIAMCKGYHCINLDFYNFTYWLCYLNSPINPFCYAFANAQFKRTFLRILRFDWHRT